MKVAERKCDLWSQIWSVLNFWPQAAILDFALFDKFLRKLVCRVKKYDHDKFCPNLINEIQMPSRNVICGVKFGRFWLNLCRPYWILSAILNYYEIILVVI